MSGYFFFFSWNSNTVYSQFTANQHHTNKTTNAHAQVLQLTRLQPATHSISAAAQEQRGLQERSRNRNPRSTASLNYPLAPLAWAVVRRHALSDPHGPVHFPYLRIESQYRGVAASCRILVLLPTFLTSTRFPHDYYSCLRLVSCFVHNKKNIYWWRHPT